MKHFKKYLTFCQKFHNRSFPKLKFKPLNEQYRILYREFYNVEEEDINKASFFVFLFCFFIILTISVVIMSLNFIFIILSPLIFSLIFSYKFNLVIYRDIKKIEAEINAMLYLIKIDFSIIQKTLKSNSDYYYSFIKLINEYNIPFLSNFKKILKNIHEGKIPENEIKKIITPSNDFNLYLKNLLISEFTYNPVLDDYKESSLENNFKIYLKEVQSKISIIFFIGIFFPIGLCFLIFFQIINLIILLLIIPLFLYLLNFLCNKFIQRNTYMIGVLNDYTGIEKKKFKEFLFFLKSFALNLRNNVSPEKAFQRTYSDNKNLFKLLEKTMKSQLSKLLNINCSFNDILNVFKQKLNSVRYTVILDTIERFIGQNPYYSSEKIFNIIELLNKHQNLEKKLEIIIKGEKFKIFFFIFLLPILIGAISGLIPFFTLITRNTNQINTLLLFDFNNGINISYLIVLYLTFTFSISITSHNFLKIIKYRKKFLIILLSNLIFVLTFFLSFYNTINIL
ncbi:MAG: hypothetical protein ACFFEY_15845 [Candidatus Thorarchaeota archaeon]